MAESAGLHEPLIDATTSHATGSTSFATAPSSQDAKVLDALNVEPTSSLDLSTLPPIFVLGAHLEEEELHRLETGLIDAGAPLTYDAQEAKLFVGKIEQRMRARMELRAQGLWTEDAPKDGDGLGRARKRRRLEGGKSKEEPIDVDNEDDSTTESEGEMTRKSQRDERPLSQSPLSPTAVPPLEKSFSAIEFTDTIKVVKLAWLNDSLDTGKPLPLKDYLIYDAVPYKKPASPEATQSAVKARNHSSKSDSKERKHTSSPEAHPISSPSKTSIVETNADDIMARAQSDAPPPDARHTRGFRRSKFHRSPDPAFSHHIFASSTQQQPRSRPHHKSAPLLQQQTTSEDESSISSSPIPPPPEWVRQNLLYACQRPALMNPPNSAFIAQLKQIRLARELIGDEIGIRAYSTAIAAISAYPHKARHIREITQLPGCDNKITTLWAEWYSKARECLGEGGSEDDAKLSAVQEFENDDQMKVLRLFYEIWGVGAQTAREFYSRNWRDLDDVVTQGWGALNRVQQIGVKYYEEFQQNMQRSEVEFISSKVLEHARKVRPSNPNGFDMCIVGGYRRGKSDSGDVDVIITHREESQTLGIINDIVASLMDAGWVTHELVTYTSGTKRDQATLPFRSAGGGHGFDSLDKTLCVWQDPDFEAQPDEDGRIRNPNVHRRVDIIIAPWSKIGCAVLGWTASTTFERDLRRYARKVKGWKFDSSGVRDRVTGQEIDLERGGTAATIEEAERRVFEGFGLEWREPWERCSG